MLTSQGRSVRVTTIIMAGVILAMFWCGPTARGANPIPFREVLINSDSGLITSPSDEDPLHGPTRIYSTTITVPESEWIRLKFAELILAGSPLAGNGSFIQVSSARDGRSQRLDSRHLSDWNNTTAVFNGDTVTIELFAYSRTGVNRVSLSKAWASEPGGAHLQRSTCGPVDDRVLSSDPRQGRIWPVGCTAWLIDDGNCANQFLTAGHCIGAGAMDLLVQFNVPLSLADGTAVAPPPEDQFPVIAGSIQSTGSAGIGLDAAQFFTGANSNTDIHARAHMGGRAYRLSESTSAVAGDTIRITGYGAVSPPVSSTWNLVQKTGIGPLIERDGSTLKYAVDAEGGNSGSPVVTESDGLAIGIHTHGGCAGLEHNYGTSLSQSALQAFLESPLGPCAPMPNQYVYASDYNEDRILRYDQVAGTFLDVLATGNGLARPDGLCFSSNGTLLVTSKTNSRVLEFERSSGLFVRLVCSPPSPEDAQLGADGLLYTSTFNSNLIRRFDPTTGQAAGTFGNVSPMSNPVNLQFGPDGHLYVCGFNSGNVNRLDGASGAFLGVFVANGSGGISGLEGLVFGPHGELYVASRNNGQVIKFNGQTGLPTGWVAQLPTTGTQGLTFLCNGNLLASTFGSGSVYEIDVASGNVVREFENPGGNRSSGLLAWPGQPSVICPPDSIAVHAGVNVQFSIVASGSTPITYEWRHNGVLLDPSSNPSAASATLSLPTVDVADAGTYDCRVSNQCGSRTSRAAQLNIAPPCAADFDGNGSREVSDIFAFLTAWFANDPAAYEFGGTPGVSAIFAFLTVWFDGCG